MKPIDFRAVEIVGGDTERHVELIACWRYLGQALPSGTRVDLRCGTCTHRVATDQNSVRFHAAGAELMCHQCLRQRVVVRAEESTK